MVKLWHPTAFLLPKCAHIQKYITVYKLENGPLDWGSAKTSKSIVSLSSYRLNVTHLALAWSSLLKGSLCSGRLQQQQTFWAPRCLWSSVFYYSYRGQRERDWVVPSLYELKSILKWTDITMGSRCFHNNPWEKVWTWGLACTGPLSPFIDRTTHHSSVKSSLMVLVVVPSVL